MQKFKHYRLSNKGAIECHSAGEVARLLKAGKIGRSYLMENGTRVPCVYAKRSYFKNEINETA
jgi:stage V sporulation protein SpoVS